MKIAFFDTHRFDRVPFDLANGQFGQEISYLEVRLSEETCALAAGHDVVCVFVNDRVSAAVIESLKASGVKLLALRSAGFNHVDLVAAANADLRVVRVPEYSPYAVAEHAVTLILALNRHIHRAFARVREGNFSLEGLVGFDLHGKTVGVVGTGKIGAAFARIMGGFGCEVLAFDVKPDAELARAIGMKYVSMDEIFEKSQIISLHVPLTPETRHLVDASALSRMKKGVMLINTGRGALIDTTALIQALKSEHVGAAGLDVYEEEEGIFFRDLSDHVLQDDVLARLLTFPNVLLTSHQAFLTREALCAIAETTLQNIADFAAGKPLRNEVSAARNVSGHVSAPGVQPVR